MSESQPADILEAIDFEIAMLFDDLNEATKEALRGEWSMRCDSLLERITELVAIGGSVPELRQTAMTAALYRSVMHRIGTTDD